jgi:SAM-dependent methyltransferase
MNEQTMWNQRYDTPSFVYGTEPNSFLVSVAHHIPRGRVLSLGEGEGRNAVFLASLGHDVTGVDSSDVGLAKAQKLADSRGLRITTLVRDLTELVIEPSAWDGIISIFCHLPAAARRRIHAAAVAGLRPGGVFILEAYTPRQLEYGTGGPKSADLLVTLVELREELVGLRLVHAVEKEESVVEGELHTGLAHVVQVSGVKE